MTLLLRQLGLTLYMLGARRRTYLGFAAFIFFDLILLGMLQNDHLREAARAFYLKHRGYSAPEFFSGLTIAHVLVSQWHAWAAALFPAMIAGDLVAREIEDGTMSMTLVRPVSRLRVLTARWGAAALFSAVFAFALAAFALVCGALDGGLGNLLVQFPEGGAVVAYGTMAGLARFLFAIPFQALALVSAGSLAFVFSCARLKPMGAIITTLTLLYADRFLHQTPIFRSFRPWFLTGRLDDWIRIYEPAIPWESMLRNAGVLLAFNAVCLALGALLFSRRDLKP